MFDYAAAGLAPPTRRPEIPGRPQSVAAILDPVLARDPGRAALVGRHGRFSYAELDRAANRAAAALQACGVGPGDRVAACLPNDADIVVAFLASMRLGALWVGLNRVLAPPEKAWILEDCGAALLLAAPDVARELAPFRARLASLRIVPVDPSDPHAEWGALCAQQSGDARPAVEIDPWGPAAIAYTSGTTGQPKGAVHSQHNILLPGAVSAAQRVYPEHVPQGTVLPLTILNLIVLGPVQAWQNGSACVAMDRIDAMGVAEWIEKERIGSFAAVPTVIHDLLTHPEVRPGQLVSFTQPMVGGATCPEEFRALYRARFGRDVSIGYGMTEAPTAVTRADGAPVLQPGLCGLALPQVEISIRDESGRALPPGEEGEICIGPARTGAWAGVYTPMLGYWRRPEATAKALRDGIYYTGDIGVQEQGGTLYIRGRRNELILRGGANVYPAEVERVLALHPAVSECAVLGLPDRRLGERVGAVVVLAPGAEASAEALQAHCAAELARYKVPERIAFARTLPRNAMSKVIKRELVPLFEARDS
ncbi:MAG TPA: AMP-binding protein [Myxococcota bacterium]|nr:AMP-binding protein [Myxococcota bacterium]